MKHVMVTCYDATFAKIVADSEAVDSVLVGDSLGMVVQGHDSTLPVTVQEMSYHLSSVKRGFLKSRAVRKPLLIGDMPAHSYDSLQVARRSAALLVQAGADLVKTEGPVTEVIEGLVEEGFRVCGHIGLTPQSIHEFKLQGKTDAEGTRLLSEALAIEKSGAEMIVLEMIPASLAKRITDSVKIPTIGIGAGPECSGQVLVLYDLLGLNAEFNPKFLKKYLDGANLIDLALKSYSSEVRRKHYPGPEHSFRGMGDRQNLDAPHPSEPLEREV